MTAWRDRLVIDTNFAVLDTETTGVNYENDEVVEIAATIMRLDSPRPLGLWTTFVRPTVAMPPEVRAIHHITDYDLRNAPDYETALEELGEFLWRYVDADFRPPVRSSHNSPFDAAFLGGMEWDDEAPWIDSCRLAKHLAPDAPRFGNQVLRYYFGLDVDTLGIAPHRAHADTLVTAPVLRYMLLHGALPSPLSELTLGEVYDLSQKPVRTKKLRFGKHVDTPTAEVPLDYLEWIVSPRGPKDRLKDDIDLAYTVKCELDERRGVLLTNT